MERIRAASITSARTNSFTIDLDWIFNTYFYMRTLPAHAYYPNYTATVRQAIRGSFTELPITLQTLTRPSPEAESAGNPTAGETTLQMGQQQQ
ncbi:hypothetical protein [Enterococcus mundtii]|uniref:hypothetical protein n=1 Tax=Enterococcus mundtii TaxID=53346 RepID=UPI0035C6AF6B